MVCSIFHCYDPGLWLTLMSCYSLLKKLKKVSSVQFKQYFSLKCAEAWWCKFRRLLWTSLETSSLNSCLKWSPKCHFKTFEHHFDDDLRSDIWNDVRSSTSEIISDTNSEMISEVISEIAIIHDTIQMHLKMTLSISMDRRLYWTMTSQNMSYCFL